MTEENTVRPQIPAGTYLVDYLGAKITPFMGQDKLLMTFAVVEHKEFDGVLLERWYPGFGKTEGGQMKIVAQTGFFLQDFYRCHPTHPRVTRLDRFPMSVWAKGGPYMASVKLVMHDHQGTSLPEQMWYSIIDRLLGSAYPEDNEEDAFEARGL
jgi:hypothetical protein